jgi:hypothetical protein
VVFGGFRLSLSSASGVSEVWDAMGIFKNVAPFYPGANDSLHNKLHTPRSVAFAL